MSLSDDDLVALTTQRLRQLLYAQSIISFETIPSCQPNLCPTWRIFDSTGGGTELG
jgi:hypothetical protein